MCSWGILFCGLLKCSIAEKSAGDINSCVYVRGKWKSKGMTRPGCAWILSSVQNNLVGPSTISSWSYSLWVDTWQSFGMIFCTVLQWELSHFITLLAVSHSPYAQTVLSGGCVCRMESLRQRRWAGQREVQGWMIHFWLTAEQGLSVGFLFSIWYYFGCWLHQAHASHFWRTEKWGGSRS